MKAVHHGVLLVGDEQGRRQEPEKLASPQARSAVWLDQFGGLFGLPQGMISTTVPVPGCPGSPA
jgi:hypothetical protein